MSGRSAVWKSAVSSNTARRRSYEVQLRQVILLTSYGTCLHVAGSVGDKPGPGSRRVLTRRRKGQWC